MGSKNNQYFNRCKKVKALSFGAKKLSNTIVKRRPRKHLFIDREYSQFEILWLFRFRDFSIGQNLEILSVFAFRDFFQFRGFVVRDYVGQPNCLAQAKKEYRIKIVMSKITRPVFNRFHVYRSPGDLLKHTQRKLICESIELSLLISNNINFVFSKF